MLTYFWYVEILRTCQTCSKRQCTVFLIPGLESESGPLTSQEVSSNHPLFPSHTSWVEQWNSGPSSWLQTVKSAHFLSYCLIQTPLILLYSPVVQLLSPIWLNSTHQFAFLFHCLRRNIYFFFKDSYMFWFYLCKFYLNHHVFGAEKVS